MIHQIKQGVLMRAIRYLLLILAVLTTLSCYARVLEHTKTTATILGEGDSKFDAKENAEWKASKLFASYKQVKPEEYTQEIGPNNMGLGRTATFWTCVIFVEATERSTSKQISPPVNIDKTLTDILLELHTLKENGLISEIEYQELRKRALSR
jgi:hypothetical protein